METNHNTTTSHCFDRGQAKSFIKAGGKVDGRFTQDLRDPCLIHFVNKDPWHISVLSGHPFEKGLNKLKLEGPFSGHTCNLELFLSWLKEIQRYCIVYNWYLFITEYGTDELTNNVRTTQNTRYSEILPCVVFLESAEQVKVILTEDIFPYIKVSNSLQYVIVIFGDDNDVIRKDPEVLFHIEDWNVETKPRRPEAGLTVDHKGGISMLDQMGDMIIDCPDPTGRHRAIMIYVQDSSIFINGFALFLSDELTCDGITISLSISSGQ